MTASSTLSSASPAQQAVLDAVAAAARAGLVATPRTLPPWLFYDEAGSQLFEAITTLPEYYLTRTERGILAAHAGEILAVAAGGSAPLTLLELGAGTATKTGLLLRSAVERQGSVLYQPIDVSPTALDEARQSLERDLPGVTVRPQVANYTADPITVERPAGARVLALYIGSSIGNFSPAEARVILRNLRSDLRAGDSLLLGTDLAPGEHKPVATLVAAYDDASGVTGRFNLNILTRLNRDLGSDFRPECFEHQARWNSEHSRMEMHLVSLARQTVHLPANAAGSSLNLHFEMGETIHTENSYKFTAESLSGLLESSGFRLTRTWHDPLGLFAVTISRAE